MKPKKATSLDVIKAFYISQELLGGIFHPEKKRITATVKKNLKKKIKKIITQTNKLSKKQLLSYSLDHYHPRYDHYINSKWEIKEIPLSDCGVWPKMGGLPDEYTRGSVVDTANHLRPLLEDKNKLTLATARALYVEYMKDYAEDITDLIPIIVLEDGVIRHNKLVKEKQRKLYKKCKYDIDDGNHRALAMALLGKTKIKALVGKRIYKSDLLY